MNILLLDGGKAFGHSAGRLNHTLHQTARSALQAQGHHTRETVIDEGYDLPQEVDKFLWMDAVIWQMPGWWMGPPWTVKKYVDEVFTAGAGMLFSNDGRSSASPHRGVRHRRPAHGPSAYALTHLERTPGGVHPCR